MAPWRELIRARVEDLRDHDVDHTEAPVAAPEPASPQLAWPRTVHLPAGYTDTAGQRARLTAALQARPGMDCVQVESISTDPITGKLTARVTPEPNPRPQPRTRKLDPGTRPTMGSQNAAYADRQGRTQVYWDPYRLIAVTAALPPATRGIRDRLASHLRCDPWDVEVLPYWRVPDERDGPAIITEIRVLRHPASTTTEKRDLAWLDAVSATVPAVPGMAWKIENDVAAGTFTLRRDGDPLDVVVPFNEDVTTAVAPDTPWHVGVDENGRGIDIDLASSAHMLIAGATRSGKSVCTYALITHVLRMRGAARLLVADPNDTTIAPFEPLVSYATTDTHPSAVTDMLRWARGEMDRRKPILREMRADKISKFTDQLPLIVIIIDEAANYLRHNDKPAAAELAGELLAVVSQGAKYGIRLVLITQRPDSTILPTATRAQLSARISFRVEDLETAKMVFPDLPDPAVLLRMPPGVGYVREVGAEARRFRSVYLADHWGVADEIPYSQPKITPGVPLPEPPRDDHTIAGGDFTFSLDDLEGPDDDDGADPFAEGDTAPGDENTAAATNSNDQDDFWG